MNRQSLLGVSHQEAVHSLLSVKDKLVMLVCDGFDAALITGRTVPQSSSPNQVHVSDCSSQQPQAVRQILSVYIHAMQNTISVEQSDEWDFHADSQLKRQVGKQTDSQIDRQADR